MDLLFRFLGRLHPLVVHFPIALLISALAIEMAVASWRGLRRSEPDPRDPDEQSPDVARDAASRPPVRAAVVCVLIGAVSAGAAAWFGWINAAVEPHGASAAETIEIHRWTGVATAGLAALALVVAVAASATRLGVFARVYRFVLLMAALLVGVTGHFGASLVYGPTYLTEIFGSEEESGEVFVAAPLPPGATVDFVSQVWPILEERCVECHGPTRARGRLRLDSPGRVFGADESRWVVRPGDPEASELLRRITLPPGDEEFMPKEREPLSSEQIGLIRLWIAEGAHWPAAGVPTEPTAGETASPVITVDAVAVEAAIARLRGRGAHAARIAADAPEVEVSFAQLGAGVTDDDLALLRGLEGSLVWLNLAGTSVTDAGMSRLEGFARLGRLQLQRTGVGDGALERLARLPRLETLNLYGTPVTDAGLARLRSFPALRRVYVWDTAVTREGARALTGENPAIEVVLGAELPADVEWPVGTATAVAERVPACCAAATAQGQECDHPCCVAARAVARVCSDCLSD
ncbi:MAG: hypothetical protein KIS87_09120 [Phycisphaeraceae bacterium]|nr:hypothetical protein [Phycisphaeraceae bacterium]